MDDQRVLDPVRIFLPTISDAEHKQRDRIRIARNIATAKIPQLKDAPGARQLCWLVIDTATEWMLSPATLEALEMVAEQCRRLLIVADTAEMLETLPQ
ncbi:hypothetical protein [Sphingobium ummariense]|uniref:Uncharacterized protein n=1 Tax=Sphingobium ummariense RL-3 TaxID=1346791 RepID=T0KFS3_9SPHN|nr:hypothetical protein [Sphingobium ummariense]EQB32258.1 hypothetical protein M529_10675 [Sphingobium ummariense RL-3]